VEIDTVFFQGARLSRTVPPVLKSRNGDVLRAPSRFICTPCSIGCIVELGFEAVDKRGKESSGTVYFLAIQFGNGLISWVKSNCPRTFWLGRFF
jgi:hypothetical protein